MICLKWNKLPNIAQKAVVLFEDFIPLFRKDSLLHLLCGKYYIPQASPNCRWYQKPVDGSCGNGIMIYSSQPSPDENFVVSPEILTKLQDGFGYDWRLWVGLCSDGTFHICSPTIQRIASSPFSIDSAVGSITNVAQGSRRVFHDTITFMDESKGIIADVLKTVLQEQRQFTKTRFMLTGWDFIVHVDGDLKLLEINTSPGMDVSHQPLMDNFLKWVLSV